MGTTQRKQASSSSWARVDGVSTEQTILSGAGVLQRITVTGDGAAGTVTVSDGPAGTPANILTILEIAASDSKTFEFGCNMTNGIRITPGETTTDICVIYN